VLKIGDGLRIQQVADRMAVQRGKATTKLTLCPRFIQVVSQLKYFSEAPMLFTLIFRVRAVKEEAKAVKGG